MADRTGIEWTDASWNPLRGCTRVSPGCVNCYAEKIAARFSGPGQAFEGLATRGPPRWTNRVVTVEGKLSEPLHWRAPRKIFVNSMSDLFHEDVPFAFVDRVVAVMACCPQHQFQVLTKRPERMREYMSDPGAARRVYWWLGETCSGELYDQAAWAREEMFGDDHPWPLPNIWLGVSVEDQKRADERIPALLDTPAAVRFLSCEPLLGPVDLREITTAGVMAAAGNKMADCLHWVIAGGESGAGARPMDPDWARGLRDQCQAAGVPFFFKQWGAWHPNGQVLRGEAGFTKLGAKRSGRLLDGREWNQFP